MSILTLRARVEYGIMGIVSQAQAPYRRWRLLAGATMLVGLAAGVLAAACTGDDESFRPAASYVYDASTFDRAPAPVVAIEAAPPPLSCGDAGNVPPRLLLVPRERSQLTALNLDTFAADGRYEADAGASISMTSSVGNSDPWLIDAVNDRVTRLDARDPWKPLATWDVRGDDGTGASMPSAVVQVSCSKAYVLRANRDRIAIIDPSQPGGVPTGYVDFSFLGTPGDTGTRDLGGAVWAPAKKKVFVLAGNFDRTTKDCKDLKSSLFAIDLATDRVVSLAGKGAAGSIELNGYAASSLMYDAAFDRLLTLSAGCQNGGTLERALVEQIDLATGAVATLFTSDRNEPPTGLALLDGDHAVLNFQSRAFYWNPHDPTLGPEIFGGLDLAAVDGRGGLVGARRGDGGIDLVALPLEPDAGAPRVLATTPGSNAASLEPWPHR